MDSFSTQSKLLLIAGIFISSSYNYNKKNLIKFDILLFGFIKKYYVDKDELYGKYDYNI